MVLFSLFVDPLPPSHQTGRNHRAGPQRIWTTQYFDIEPVALPWRKSQAPDRGLSLRPDQVGFRPKEYLSEYKGCIQTNGYSGYQVLGESDGIIHVGYMAPIRRKFMDVQKASPKRVVRGTAKEIFDFIGLLCKVEHNTKELSPEEKVSKRREQVVPILDAIRAILDDRIDHVPP
jgi:hypothetical protein